MDSKDIQKFSDVIKYIEIKKTNMSANNNFFKTIRDPSISSRQKLLFVPYMLFFSCGFADVIIMNMRVNKPDDQLNEIEKKVNDYVNEDGFHYNFYLHDLEALGYQLSSFNSSSGFARHVFSEEGPDVRILIYSLFSYLNNKDPIFALAMAEVLEAGLYDLFTSIYTEVYKKDSSLSHLQYFGDTHVMLEQNHTATGWFADEKKENESNYPINKTLAVEIVDMVDGMMSRFDNMYTAFNNVVMANKDIEPIKFDIRTTPPMDRVTTECV